MNSETTSEHYEAIKRDVNELVGVWVVSKRIDTHAAAMAARIDRLQHLWHAWQRAQGYAPDSERYLGFLTAPKACEDHGDLLPVEG